MAFQYVMDNYAIFRTGFISDNLDIPLQYVVKRGISKFHGRTLIGECFLRSEQM